MIYLGCDPGSVTGLCAVSVPALGPIRWLGDASIAKPQRRVGEDHSTHELRFVEKLAQAFAKWPQAHCVVIERPVDGAAFWSGQGQAGQRRGTAFALGVHYAAALLAAHQTLPQAKIVTYPVLGGRAEKGWMPSRTKRDYVLTFLRQQAGLIGAPDGVTDHVLCAWGVVRHHLDLRGVQAA